MVRPVDPEREAARVRGDTRYISTKPCPKGHVGERFVISTACCTCGDIARARRKGKLIANRSPKLTSEKQAETIEAPKVRFNRPVIRALADYGHTVEAQRHSRHLDRLTRQM